MSKVSTCLHCGGVYQSNKHSFSFILLNRISQEIHLHDQVNSNYEGMRHLNFYEIMCHHEMFIEDKKKHIWQILRGKKNEPE